MTSVARMTALFWMVFLLGSSATETLSGDVVGITDGDTVTVLVGGQPRKIRLAEIDTPESGQPWGSRAKQALSDKVYRKNVVLRVLDTDRYGRAVAHVYLGERHINREMVREGHAWAYRKYLRDTSLLKDETHAREARLGLWNQSEEPVPPWEWRRGNRSTPVHPAIDKPSRIEFACGAKRYCGEMVSCAEAQFYLRQCGLTRLDGDNDGIPCEMICR